MGGKRSLDDIVGSAIPIARATAAASAESGARNCDKLRIVIHDAGRHANKAGERRVGREPDEFIPLRRANVGHELCAEAGRDAGVAKSVALSAQRPSSPPNRIEGVVDV